MAQPHVVETVAVSRLEIDGSSRYLGSFTSAVEYTAGDTELRIHQVLIEVADEVLWTRLREGDANGNGVFGGDFGPYAIIWPGDPERSYLLARVRGAFPSHPMMPMANQPLASDELLALACWIDGLVPVHKARGPVHSEGSPNEVSVRPIVWQTESNRLLWATSGNDTKRPLSSAPPAPPASR
jgi:hypothetical protein